MNTIQMIKNKIKEWGATITGVAPVERFEGAPAGHHPNDFIVNARSVISIGLRLLPSIVDWPSLLVNSEIIEKATQITVTQDHFYGRCGYETMNILLEQIGLKTAHFLENIGFRSIYFPATYAHHAPIMEKIPGFLAPFSHKHAAVRAGLGEFGLNDLVVTPKFGPRMRFMSVITEAELKPDPLLEKKTCLGVKCSLCIKKCGTQCLSLSNINYESEIWLNVPSIVDKVKCYSRSRKVGCWGRCINVCPVSYKAKKQLGKE